MEVGVGMYILLQPTSLKFCEFSFRVVCDVHIHAYTCMYMMHTYYNTYIYISVLLNGTNSNDKTYTIG